jgi:ApaG protein
MMQQITKGICVTVETFYNEDLSNPGLNEYIYSYKIAIDNLSEFPFILKSRFWEITDALGNTRTVEGEGVVGQQPMLDQGQRFEYTSAVGVKTDMGKMTGFYTIENLHNKEELQISIPLFYLYPPFKMN